MTNNIVQAEHLDFEALKQFDENGNEFWYARPLSKALGYTDFRNFVKVINKAVISCERSGHKVSDHIVELNEMVKIGSETVREISSYRLSRYACYLVVQNADPSKPIIAAGQTYFAIQTRRQELQNDTDFGQLDEDQKRLFLRDELKKHNKQLVEAAALSGVETNIDFAIFQNHGYQGLYGGLGAKEIHQHKGLKKSHKILDYMGSTELAANLFRATQTEEKLKRDYQEKGNSLTKQYANNTHYKVGNAVRQTIQSLGGTMPEELPTPQKSIQKIAKQAKLESDDEK
ncbi:MAG: DNA damage-inducible protein D [Gammaproteobacteria bacterium]|nr:DNA damage-inducible protein D [Gammaproteobacteria bacterium]